MEEQLVNREIKFNVPKKLTKAEFISIHAPTRGATKQSTMDHCYLQKK